MAAASAPEASVSPLSLWRTVERQLQSDVGLHRKRGSLTLLNTEHLLCNAVAMLGART